MASFESLVTMIPSKTLQELIVLLWGPDIKHDLFWRWNQGFTFSDDEPTALLQQDGGPCAVIVPVQAYLLKNLLFASDSVTDNWRQVSVATRNRMLCRAITDIIIHSRSSTEAILVHCERQQQKPVPPTATSPSVLVDTESASILPESAAVEDSPSSASSVQNPTPHLVQTQLSEETTSTSPKRQRLSHDEFHSCLRMRVYRNESELCEAVEALLPVFQGDCGVLLLLYSILLTKVGNMGLDGIKREVADLDEALIDSVHGHGSQSLINLLLTGKAASHVWDNEKDVSGLKLQGISSKSEIGFLTLLEHLRYCEVGWYLKNPLYPIWLLGSETHLTILFSLDRTLVGEETSAEKARRLFGQFDEEGRGFIAVDCLGELMKQLDLVSLPDYVKIMADKLDPEQLGVITLNGFLEEFFSSGKSDADDKQTFTVYHYNGLPQSCPDNKVMYTQATCLIMDMPELQLISDFSTIKTCLLTKWPTIDLNWKNNVIPSMN